jgi:deazaflavin-dependent oxidoreductase (nitroreductase family)
MAGNATGQAQPLNRAPRFVRLIDPVARQFLRMGAPMGPNVLLTVRGRKSGQPRSAGVALTEIDGRRFVVGAYGEVHWVRNLRSAGEGTLRVRGRDEAVRAVELTGADALAFFRDILSPWVARSSLPRRWASRIFLGDVVGDPVAAAEHHPVFELHRRAG